MMTDFPLIVFSGTHEKNGQTTLALNLAAALWQDNYQVLLTPQSNSDLDAFISMRKNSGKLIYIPRFYPSEPLDNQVVVADIKNSEMEENINLFNHAHTLITVINSENDIDWSSNDQYLNFIWDIKKNQASKGRKYLNWIVIPNLCDADKEIKIEKLKEMEKRFGFRLAPIVKYRKAYQNVFSGLCPAEMISDNLSKSMTLADVYARREILELAAFIWQNQNM